MRKTHLVANLPFETLETIFVHHRLRIVIPMDQVVDCNVDSKTIVEGAGHIDAGSFGDQDDYLVQGMDVDCV